jgi:hypothetical protein
MAKEKISLNELSHLNRKEVTERARKFANRYCVGDGKKFHLKDYNTDDFPELSKEENAGYHVCTG